MSTISVSNITTANGSSDLTVSTGNTLAGDITIPATGGIVIAPNSSVNSIIVSVGSVANIFVTNSTGSYFTGNTNFDSGILFTDGTNNRVGVNNTTPDAALTVTGAANVSGNVTFTSNTFTLGASSNAASGYTILPNQLKMNWGVAVPNSVGSNTVSFSSAFTTNAYTVALTIRASVANTGTANAKSVTFSAVNTSTITINVANTTVGTNTGVLGVHYLAIGPA